MAKTVFSPDVIQDQPFPSDLSSLDENMPASTSPTTFSPQVTPPRTFPEPKVATHTIGDSIDTQSRRIKGNFQFDKMGAIQIGAYQDGLSGELKITSNGLVARNKNNQETITIDGDTGDATFMGTVQAGSLISGSITIGGEGNGNGVMKIADANGNVIIKGDNLGHHYYDTSGHELVRVNSVGLAGYDTSGNEILLLTPSALNLYGSGGNILQLWGSPSDSQAKLVMGYNSSSSGLNTFQMTAIGSISLYGYDANSLPNHITICDNSPLFQDITIQSYKGNVNINTGGSFIVNGATKTAIVPTSEGYKALYCAESPEVWFFDFAKDENSIDPLFMEATEGVMKTLKTEEGELLVFRRRKGYEYERFTPKTVEEFNKNNSFWSTPLL